MNDITAYSKHAHTILIYLAPIVCLLLLGVVLNMTNPLQSGPVSILAVFILIYLIVFGVLSAILHLVGSIWHMVKPDVRVSLRRGYYMVSIISLAPVLFIALNTLGQLEVLEVVLIILLVGLGCFYVLRRTAK